MDPNDPNLGGFCAKTPLDATTTLYMCIYAYRQLYTLSELLKYMHIHTQTNQKNNTNLSHENLAMDTHTSLLAPARARDSTAKPTAEQLSAGRDATVRCFWSAPPPPPNWNYALYLYIPVRSEYK